MNLVVEVLQVSVPVFLIAALAVIPAVLFVIL